MAAEFRIQLDWDPHQQEGEGGPPPLKLGVFDRHITDPPPYINIPFNTPRKQIYDIAVQYCVYVNGVLKPDWECVFERNRLYQDHIACLNRHAYTTRATELVGLRHGEIAVPTSRDQAQIVAEALLRQLNPTLADKVKKGASFYLQGTKHVYIIQPQSRKLCVLYPTGPKFLCVYVTDSAVQDNPYDWMIAVWKYLVASEEKLLTTANEFEFYLTDTEEVKLVEDTNRSAVAEGDANLPQREG